MSESENCLYCAPPHLRVRERELPVLRTPTPSCQRPRDALLTFVPESENCFTQNTGEKRPFDSPGSVPSCTARGWGSVCRRTRESTSEMLRERKRALTHVNKRTPVSKVTSLPVTGWRDSGCSWATRTRMPSCQFMSSHHRSCRVSQQQQLKVCCPRLLAVSPRVGV